MADNDNLNEQVEEVIDMSDVITVPIDDTLSNSGEAADAKAVGDALALKADKSELQTAISVNGQEADNQGKIIVTAADTKMSDSDTTTVKAAIESAAGRTGADIPVDNTQGAQTIKQALASGATRTADQIEMSASDDTTVKSAIETVAGDLSTLAETVGSMESKTAADIKYQTGSNETIKQHVDALDSGLVKSVYGVGPDSDGDVSPESVPYADNLKTDEQEEVAESFIERMTGGTLSISGANAWLMKLLGNRVHTGYVAESITKTVTPMPRTAPAAITASITQATFLEEVDNETGTYTFTYASGWTLDDTSVVMSDYGISVSNDPVNDDEIIVVVAESSGSYTATLSVNAVTRTAPPDITATVDRDTWVAYVDTSGTYTFTYSTVWKLSNETVDLADYGITVTNTPVAGDQIAVVYVKEVRGSITVATPTALTASGWNLYNHTNGYARVLKYSNVYGYMIGGTFTGIKFAATLDGEQTTITPDEDGLFDVSADGYVFVTGGNATDTYIIATWSDWEEGPAGDWEAYSEASISLSTIMSSKFPYGLCKVGDVVDEIDADKKVAISRISRVAYSDESRASAAASGRGYEFDEDYIYMVRATPIESSIEIDGAYAADDHGMEWFAGTTVAVGTEILYGQNLKDKLRRDVVTIRDQTFTAGQQAKARNNIGAASAADLSSANDAIAKKVIKLSSAITIAASGSKTITNSAITTAHELIRWNFTSSGTAVAENNPPSSLTWSTETAGTLVIQNTGSSSVTCQPVLAVPTAITGTVS